MKKQVVIIRAVMLVLFCSIMFFCPRRSLPNLSNLNPILYRCLQIMVLYYKASLPNLARISADVTALTSATAPSFRQLGSEELVFAMNIDFLTTSSDCPSVPNEEDWPFIAVLRNPDSFFPCQYEVLKAPATPSTICGNRKRSLTPPITQPKVILPVQVSDCLWVSDCRAIREVDRLRELGITHVLNVGGKEAAKVDPQKYAEAGIVYHMMEAEDEENYPILQSHLEEARAFIASARKAGGSCLVHCVGGINRSCCIVTAEKMLSERITLLEAVACCHRQRGNEYLWNTSFQEQLVALARKEGLLGPKPGEPGSVVSKPSPPYPWARFSSLFGQDGEQNDHDEQMAVE